MSDGKYQQNPSGRFAQQTVGTCIAESEPEQSSAAAAGFLMSCRYASEQDCGEGSQQSLSDGQDPESGNCRLIPVIVATVTVGDSSMTGHS